MHWRISHLDFSFDKAGNIFLVLKHRQRVQQIVGQPVPVLVHLLHGSSWHTRRQKPRRGFNGRDPSDESREDTEQTQVERALPVQLTAGDHPAHLGAGNLEEDAEGRDPGVGVQHRVQRPHQETCGHDKQRLKLG